MNKDFDRSLDRYLDSEEYRAETTGFGTTKQGQAVVRKFDDELAANIAKDRAHSRRRDKEVWRVLRHLDDHTIAVRLLVAGITVSTVPRVHSILGSIHRGPSWPA